MALCFSSTGVLAAALRQDAIGQLLFWSLHVPERPALVSESRLDNSPTNLQWLPSTLPAEAIAVSFDRLSPRLFAPLIMEATRVSPQ